MNNVNLDDRIDIPLDADQIEAGDGFVDGEDVYIAEKVGGTGESDFEDDVEAILGRAGWKAFVKERHDAELEGEPKWLVSQKDYDRKLAIKTDSLISFIKETQQGMGEGRRSLWHKGERRIHEAPRERTGAATGLQRIGRDAAQRL